MTCSHRSSPEKAKWNFLFLRVLPCCIPGVDPACSEIATALYASVNIKQSISGGMIKTELVQRAHRIPNSSLRHLEQFLNRRRPGERFKEEKKEVVAIAQKVAHEWGWQAQVQGSLHKDTVDGISDVDILIYPGGVSWNKRQKFAKDMEDRLNHLHWVSGHAEVTIGEVAIHFELPSPTHSPSGVMFEVEIAVNNQHFERGLKPFKGAEQMKDPRDLHRAILMMKYMKRTLPLPQLSGMDLESIAHLAAHDLCSKFPLQRDGEIMIAPILLFASCEDHGKLNAALVDMKHILSASNAISGKQLEAWHNHSNAVLHALELSHIKEAAHVGEVLHGNIVHV